MDFEMVQKMKVDELKMFLRLRDLKVSGKKAELVARVFAASENNVPLKKTAAEVESDLRDEYQAKLLINSDLLPDPNHLTSGWLNEEDGGIYSWPCILYPMFLIFCLFIPVSLEVQISVIIRHQKHTAISTEVGLDLFLFTTLVKIACTVF